jgi:hypothetical protein
MASYAAAGLPVPHLLHLGNREADMKRTFWGALIGAIFLAAAAPAGASTVTGTSIDNSLGLLGPSQNFGVTNFANDSQGKNGIFFDNGKHYFDYVFSFSVTGPADLSVSATASSDTNILDYHAALFSGTYAASDLDVLSNPGPLIGLTGPGSPLASASNKNNGSTNTLTLSSLATGNYYLRLFGVTSGVSANSILSALNGSFTVAAVATTPIPAALPLFGTALGLFGFMGWRRKAASAAAA